MCRGGSTIQKDGADLKRPSNSDESGELAAADALSMTLMSDNAATGMAGKPDVEPLWLLEGPP